MPGIYANPGKLYELVLYISVSLVLQRANLLPKPVQIMQNTTVDHRLTHQAAQCNWSVCSRHARKNTGHPPCVRVVQHTKVSFHMGIWAVQERPKELTAHFYFFNVSLHVFLNTRNATWSWGPETDPQPRFTCQGNMGSWIKCFTATFLSGKKTWWQQAAFSKSIITNNNQINSY